LGYRKTRGCLHQLSEMSASPSFLQSGVG
jgi:hypothetical protein